MPQPRLHDHRWITFTLACLAFMVIFLGTPTPATAQEFDEEEFIAGLAERGLDGLIDQMIANPPVDPVRRGKLVIALANHYLPTKKDPQQWQTTFDQVNAMYQKLAKEQPARMPQLASDFSQALLFNVMSANQRGDLFVLYGAATADEIALATQLSTHAIDQLTQALGTLNRLKRELPRLENFNSDYVNTGIWSNLKKYSESNIPYFLAWSRMCLASLPDDADYFHGKASKERDALLKKAFVNINSVIEQYKNENDGFKARVHQVRGQLYVLKGQGNNAMKEFDKVLKFNKDEVAPEVFYLAKLGHIMALQVVGSTNRLKGKTDALLRDELLRGNLLYRILVYDNQSRWYRRKMAKAKGAAKQKLLAQTFKPYEDLLADSAVADKREGVEQFIFARFSQGLVAEGDLSTLPPLVQLGAAVEKYNTGLAARQSGDSTTMKSVLTQAIVLLEPLSKNQKAGDSTKARALQMLGASQYMTGDAGHAIATMISLAQNYPALPEGEKGLHAALIWAGQVWSNARNNDRLRPIASKLYAQAFSLLYDQYSTSKLADENTYAFAAFLRETERYRKAVTAYDRVAENHEFYIDALYEKLTCLSAIWSKDRGNADLGKQLLKAIAELKKKTSRAMAKVGADRRSRYRRYLALAELSGIGISVEAAPDKAVRQLDALVKQYSDLNDLPMKVKSLKIRALQVQHRWAQVEQEIKSMANSAPDQAGPFAVGAIQAVFSDIKKAQKQNDQKQIDELGQIALALSDWIWQWVQTQSDWNDRAAKEKLAYQLMPARSMLYCKKYDQAARQFAAMRATPLGRTNIDVVAGLAECYFQIGKQQATPKQAMANYRKASELFNAVIDSDNGQLSPEFWLSQTRLLTMVDLTSTKKPNSSIARNVQRLMTKDSKLGGEPYASILRALMDKHAAR